MTTTERPTVPNRKHTHIDDAVAEQEAELPVPPPLLGGTSSGLYMWRPSPTPTPNGDGLPVAPLPIMLRREELRLDVDGRYPQMTASGTSFALLERYHWVAKLTKIAPRHWEGPIWLKDGNAAAFDYTNVAIKTTGSIFPWQRKAAVTFTGGGQSPLTRTYDWTSAAHHNVELEFDHTSDANPVFVINTHDHPNRPASLPAENLSIEDVFARSGFAVTKSGGDSQVPLAGAGANGTWSDAEMHDAMQTFWSRFSTAPRWSLWTFWAALHDQGTSLGGIMFDDIGPNHRQGTAIFTESFITNAPANDPDPAAWVARMRFWTAVHEMGHAFNLAHAWQKSLGTPWIPLANEPESRSFMNYPFRVTGGEKKFFADFPFRFSDPELLFMRHAPSRFVQMGNAAWFDHHGLEDPDGTTAPYNLVVRVNRDRPIFDFLEPVILEVKLTNDSADPKLVPSAVLHPQHVLVVIKQKGKPARQWLPYARECHEARVSVMQPGESVYESLPVFAGLNGWDVSEPGVYEIRVAIEIDGALVTSRPLQLRIAPPKSWDEEDVAQEFFSEDVGRTLSFSGTAVLTSANEVLRNTVERLPDTRAAIHAATALATPIAKDHKVLVIPETNGEFRSVAAAGGMVEERPARVDEAIVLCENNLTGVEAAETFGNIAFRRKVEAVNAALVRNGALEPAAELQTSLHDVLAERHVLPSVVESVGAKATALKSSAAKAKRTEGSSRKRTGK